MRFCIDSYAKKNILVPLKQNLPYRKEAHINNHVYELQVQLKTTTTTKEPVKELEASGKY